jgi:hypothetical protein
MSKHYEISVPIMLASFVCVCGLFLLALRLAPKQGQIEDFVQEWASARNHLHGRSVYEDLRISVTREFGPERAAALPIRHNGHPPVAVLLALPLRSLDYRTAHFVWNLASVAPLIAAMWLVLGRWGLNLPASSWAYVGAILLLSSPLARQVDAGQLNLLLLFFITGGWVALRNGRDRTARVLLGTAAAVKLFPAFLFLFPLVLGRWRVIAAGGVTFLTLNATAAAVLGIDVFRDFATLVLPELRTFQDWWLNFSLTGFFRKLLYVTSGHSVPFWQNAPLCFTLIGICTLGVTVAAGWKIRTSAGQGETDASTDDGLPERSVGHSPNIRLDVAFAVCLIANLLVTPITWDHYFVLLVLPILIFWKVAASTGRRVFLMVCVLLLSINVQWIWNPLISGDHELAGLWGGEQSIASPIEAMTLLSYPFYTLSALLIFGLMLSSPRASESGIPASRS